MNRFYPHPIIAQEGWCIITIFAAWTLWLALFGSSIVYFVLVLLATLFTVYLFRDVARPINPDARTILCPADGYVVLVEQGRDPYLHTIALKISIVSKSTRAYALRSPLRGILCHVAYTEGRHYRAKKDYAGTENTRHTLHIEAANGIACTVVQASGKLSRRIACYVEQGNTILRGERFGFTLGGGRVDIYLPVDAIPNVAIGDRVKATSTILARVAYRLPFQTEQAA